MIIRKKTVASKVIAVLLAMIMLLAANCIAFDASAAGNLGTTVYLKTTETTTPYLHYWDANNKGSDWPGVAMKSEGNDIYSYDIGADLSTLYGVIFKKDGGSGDDSKLTQDVTGITGNLYDLSSKTWSMYDESPVKISDYGIDNEALYVGGAATLSMTAKGEGALQYQFSANGTVLSAFSSKSSYLWTPDKAGDYTLLFEVKNAAGDTNSREMTVTVKSIDGEEDPIFLGATPANGSRIKTNTDITINVQGAGGQVNNKILFYKTEIKDPSGNTVNVPYYQTSSKITFKPTAEGEYTVTMYIQNNTIANTTTKATYTYVSTPNASDTDSEEISDTDSVDDTDSVEKPSDTDSVDDTDSVEKPSDTDSVDDTDSVEKPSDTDSVDDTDSVEKPSDTDTEEKPSDTDTEEKPSDTDTEEKPVDIGDYDGNGETELMDAYAIQLDVLAKVKPDAAKLARGDVNHDGVISLKDASLIQQYKAGLVSLK